MRSQFHSVFVASSAYSLPHDFLAVCQPGVPCLQAVAVALYNPEAFRAIGHVRLDVGRVLPEHMSDEAYRELLVRSSSLRNIRPGTLL